MKRALCWIVVIAAVLTLAGTGIAATISGQVREQESGDSISCWVAVYKWNGSYWVWAAGKNTSVEDPYFKFNNLAAGKYYVSFESTNHITEYYNNKTASDEKTEITLEAATVLNMGAVRLKRLPLRIINILQDINSVPAAGGTVKVSFEAVNDTSKPKEVVVWVVVNAVRYLYGSTYANSLLESDSKTLTLPAGSTKPGVISLKVPAGAPSGSYYFYVCFGSNRWAPLAQNYWGGGFYKEQ